MVNVNGCETGDKKFYKLKLKSLNCFQRWVFLILSLTFILSFFYRISPAVIATDLLNSLRIGANVQDSYPIQAFRTAFFILFYQFNY